MDYGKRLAFFELVVETLNRTRLWGPLAEYSKEHNVVVDMDNILKGCFSYDSWVGCVQSFYKKFLQPMHLEPPELRGKRYEYFMSTVIPAWEEGMKSQLRSVRPVGPARSGR